MVNPLCQKTKKIVQQNIYCLKTAQHKTLLRKQKQKSKREIQSKDKTREVAEKTKHTKHN
jgi:hypothetical protein